MTDFRTLLEQDGRFAYTNRGNSMRPLLHQGVDIMVIEKADPPFQKNEAVLFRRDNGRYVLHRITKILPDHRYYIIGDNTPRGEVVREDQIMGILTEVRKGKSGKTLRRGEFLWNLYVFFTPLLRFLKRIRHFIGNLLVRLGLRKKKRRVHDDSCF
ncbi:MAG: hypothetical protein CW338_05050 [Clostridiales bacterium]|nr:hypothetical protein [Clostridiales bacterium]